MADFEFTTSLDAETLRAALKRPAGEAEEFERLYAEALDLCTDWTIKAHRPIPEEVCDDLLLRVARALREASRTQGEQGAQSTQVEGQTVVRRARDPRTEAEPILRQYVILGWG